LSKPRNPFNTGSFKKLVKKIATSRSETLELKEGAVLKPNYRLTRRLGAGGFGEVWEATNGEDGKVALKFIPTAKQPADIISKEVRLLTHLRQVQHENVLRILDVVCIQDMIVMIMELAKGSLHDLHQFALKDYKQHLSPKLLLNLLGQAAAGLDFLAATKMPNSQLTQSGIQHCDVKPSNLLLVGRTLKVADFGLAGSQGLQRSHGKLGTPYFMPPELYVGNATARTDQFSLAVTYCYLRTGQFPYAYDPEKPPEGSPYLVRYLPGEREVLNRALQLSWIDRYASNSEFIKNLYQALTQEKEQ
jgi:serine/threonine protein kinase